MVVTPLVAGAMVDCSAVSGPDQLDYAAIVKAAEHYGALVLTGLAVRHEEFMSITEHLSPSFMDYVGGANNDREAVDGKSKSLLTVTGGSAARYAIPLHGEMFYTRSRPRSLFFCCIRPADADGQTTICDGVAVWKALPAWIRDTFETRRIKYRRIYARPDWQKVYKTDDLERVKAKCIMSGVELTELAEGRIETVLLDHAYNDTPAGRSFINSMLVWASREYLAGRTDSLVRFEDGSELPQEMLWKINEIAESLTFSIAWQPGWVAIVDNARVMHGRRSYEDDKRDIIMRLSADALGLQRVAAE
jgi:alpha-ketoglutarate-dependent taurine dioxygenase